MLNTLTVFSDDSLFDDKFQNANRLYEKKEYSAAKDQYLELISEGLLTPEIFLNLGNSWIKLNDSANALIAYERGLILSPRNPMLMNNLKFTLIELNPEKTDLPKRSFLRFFPLNFWAIIFTCATSAFCITVGLSQLPHTPMRNLGKLTPLTLVFCIIGAGLFFFANKEWNRDVGIVSMEKIAARFGPVQEAEESFTVEPGDYLSLIDERSGWVRVVDSRNRKGWIETDYFHFISPPNKALNFSKLD